MINNEVVSKDIKTYKKCKIRNYINYNNYISQN